MSCYVIIFNIIIIIVVVVVAAVAVAVAVAVFQNKEENNEINYNKQTKAALSIKI